MSSSAPLASGDLVPQSQAAETAVSRDAVLDELNRILASTLFKHSKRCGPLLKHIVTETIDGRAEFLKERAIGVAVFGRKPAYDTNDDPIVRTSAVEVRKRIAQYYHESGHAGEVRIDVTSGSYVPKFRPPAADLATPAQIGSAAPVDQQLATPSPLGKVFAISLTGTSARNTLLRSAIVLGGVALAVAAGLLARSTLANGPMTAFWGPMLRADSVTLVVGNVDVARQPSAVSGSHDLSFYETILADRVGFADSLATARVAALLGSKGKKFEIRRGRSVTLQDLRKAPAVMIGALNNPWTSKLEERLRFRVVFDAASHTSYLRDRQDPTHPLWSIDRDAPYSTLKEDRAIISRFVDSRTEQSVLLLAGFGRDGTVAAVEFVTDTRYLRTLADHAPRGWRGKNLQAVIATDLVEGHNGPPRLIAFWFW